MKFLSEILLLVVVALIGALIMKAFAEPRYRVASAEVAEQYQHEIGRQANNLRCLNEYINAHRGGMQ